jgi:hypothetical protein
MKPRTLLVIVDDFHVEAVPATPKKADAPLIVDADAVLSHPFAFQGLETVPGWNPKVMEGFGGVKYDELSKRDPLQIRREPSGPVAFEEAFRLPVPEAPDHKREC